MARSLLRQLEQIRRSATYDDAVAGVNTSAVAEPTVSGSLEEDMNVIRTLIHDLKGGSGSWNWYDALETYTDPSNTVADKSATLYNFSGNTLDANTIILAVTDDGVAGAGYTVSGTSTGLLRTITTGYADTTDTRGLPIFLSVTNSGTYYDEGGNDNVCRIDVLDVTQDAEMQDGSGNIIYAKFYDGADYAGSGDGTDVYVKFFANDVETDLSTVDPAPTAVKFVYPQRKILSEMQEWEWLRTDFVSSWEGDVELVEDISNLWSFTGASDGDSDAGPWTNTGSYYLLDGDPSDLKTAIDDINDGVGDRSYTEDNYLTDGETITTSLDALDQAIKDNADAITFSAGDKYVESVAAPITVNTLHTLPAAITAGGGYTPNSTPGQEGKNMDVYIDGQLLAADTGANGANADRDYGETTASGITFRFNVQIGRNITYVVRT